MKLGAEELVAIKAAKESLEVKPTAQGATPLIGPQHLQEWAILTVAERLIHVEASLVNIRHNLEQIARKVVKD